MRSGATQCRHSPSRHHPLLRRNCDKITRRVKFRFSRRANHPYELTPSCPLRKGRWPSSPNVGTGCGGRGGIVRGMGLQGGINSVSGLQDVLTSGVEAYGKIVWTRRLSGRRQVCGRQSARPGRMCRLSAGDGGEKSPILRGERDISRQAIAQGMSDVLRCPVCSCAAFFTQFAHGTAGAARIRHSLLPHSRETTTGKPRATSCRENADVYLLFEIRIEMSPRHCEQAASHNKIVVARRLSST